MMFLFKYLVSEEFFLVTEPYLANHSFVFNEWNVKEYSEPAYSIASRCFIEALEFPSKKKKANWNVGAQCAGSECLTVISWETGRLALGR